jgi:hypothetical protein
MVRLTNVYEGRQGKSGTGLPLSYVGYTRNLRNSESKGVGLRAGKGTSEPKVAELC